MKTLPTMCVVLTSLSLLLAGCEETGTSENPVNNTTTTEQTVPKPLNPNQNYPDINLPLSDFATNIINDSTGVGDGTQWLCLEPATEDSNPRIPVVFFADGTGTYNSTAQNAMTWSLVDADLYIETGTKTVIYSDVEMPLFSVIQATILRPAEPRATTLRAIAPPDGTGGFSCQATSDTGDFDLLPLPAEVFANGATLETAQNAWSCEPLRSSSPIPQYILNMKLGADGSGTFMRDDRTEEPIALWNVDNRTLNIAATDGTSIELEATWHSGDRMNMKSTVNGVYEGVRSCELTNTLKLLPDLNQLVTLDVTLRDWGRSSVTIDYTLTNNGTEELISFDFDSETTTGIDENALITLYHAKRDTGEVDFESQPTIAGRNLSPGQTLTGSVTTEMPLSIDYPKPLRNIAPESILQLCIGYARGDDIIPQMRVDGTYTLNTDLALQSLTCNIVRRPFSPVV